MLKIKSIKPMYTKLIVTAEAYEKDVVSNGIIVGFKGTLREYQKVVAVGPMVRDIKVGDLVVINPTKYIKKKYDEDSLRNDIVDNPTVKIDIPVVQMNDTSYFMIDCNDIDYIIDDFEEVEEEEVKKSTIIQPRPISTGDKKIILN